MMQLVLDFFELESMDSRLEISAVTFGDGSSRGPRIWDSQIQGLGRSRPLPKGGITRET